MIGRLVRGIDRRIREARERRKPLVLMYHRVADIACDPWNLAVTPAMFAEQVEALCKVRKVVPLEEILTAEADRPLAAITFDDGYLDVVANGLPILEEFRCPATFFIVAGAIDDRRPFWWDVLADLLLEAQLSSPVEISLSSINERIHLGPSIGIADRRQQHLRIWEKLQPLPADYRDEAIERISAAMGVGEYSSSEHRTVDRMQIRALDGSMLTVGAHTVSHPMLSALSRAEKAREIALSRDLCESLTGKPPACFAYPYGDYDADSLDIVSKAGFKLAVTVNDGHVDRNGSPWEIPRRAIEAFPIDRFVAAVA